MRKVEKEKKGREGIVCKISEKGIIQEKQEVLYRGHTGQKKTIKIRLIYYSDKVC